MSLDPTERTSRGLADDCIAEGPSEDGGGLDAADLDASRRSEERHRALLAAIPDFVARIARNGTCIDYCGPPEPDLYAPPAVFVGRKLSEVLPVDVASLFLCAIDRALATEGGVQSFEYQLPVGGRPRDREARIVRSGDDEVLCLIRDISDRKRAEIDFRLAQLHIEQTPDGALWMEPDGRIVYVNAAACRSLGYEREELLAMSIFDIAPELSRDKWPEQREECYARASAGSHEAQHRAKDGRVFPVELTVSHLELGGRELYCASVRDISERKSMQTKLLVADRMASVGALAAGVAHEINNPLAYVLANLHFVRDALATLRAAVPPGTVDMRELEEALDEAMHGADRVRTIVRELKTFSRTDEERRQPLDLHRVLEVSIRMVHNEVRHRANLARDFGAVPPVLGDESRLGQVFLNLLVNAAQAIREGEPERNEIRIVTKTGPGGEAVVEIRDTGCGIPAAVLGRIFEPFFTTKPVGEGTGLGLSVCHGIIRRMGGQIGVESQPGSGTVFRVILPAAERAPIEDAVQAAPRAAARRGSVLVVDDEPMIGRSVQRILGGAHEVTMLTSATEALELILAGKHFDVVLSDVSMPGMSGIELHAELCGRAPDVVRRLIFLTGGAFTPQTREFLDREDVIRLPKPFDAQALRALVASLVE
ncbi:MAG: PAS domain S-box protein [Deltaproteobacteria bacterium]|nr:PAS domain S-box protein [Deltaproteobacteria bacterium]